jgi:hypothetical protein
METVVLVIALWLILVGIYGALSLLSGPPRRVQGRQQRRSKAREAAPQQFTQPYNYDYDLERDASGAILSEVDLLRAQVRHLRSEVFAMSGTPQEDKSNPKPKRYRGQTDLPRPLRRHLRETRGVRTA